MLLHSVLPECPREITKGHIDTLFVESVKFRAETCEKYYHAKSNSQEQAFVFTKFYTKTLVNYSSQTGLKMTES